MDEMLTSAREVLRRGVRDAMLGVIRSEFDPGRRGELEALEDAVCRAIEKPDTAWALACIAAVRMAPELVRKCAQARPATPSQEGGVR